MDQNLHCVSEKRPTVWYTTLSEVLPRYGLVRSFRELCLFYSVSEGTVLLVLTYVDDILIASGSQIVSRRLVLYLQQHLAVMYIELPKEYVGFELEYSPETERLRLHQTTYAKEIIDTFLPENERFPRKVPMNLFGNFPRVPYPDQKLDQISVYRLVVGSLYYLANMTRPDILFAVNYLSRSQSSSTKLHQKLLLMVLRYMYAAVDLGLQFSSLDSEDLAAYVDADFGSGSPVVLQIKETDIFTESIERLYYEKHKSTTGCVVLFGNPILWICRKQTLLTLSTTEAEYVVVACLVPQILFLHELTREVFPNSVPTVCLYEDNLSTTSLLQSVFIHC